MNEESLITLNFKVIKVKKRLLVNELDISSVDVEGSLHTILESALEHS